MSRKAAVKSALILSLLGATGLLSGCQISEKYLVPRRSIELLSSLQPNERPRARVPAIHEPDRAPVLIDYRALQVNDAELAQINAHPARFYRMRAAQRNPLVLIGGVILGMALPHFLLGLSVGIDKPSGTDQRAITDTAGGILALTLAGLHIATGVTLIGLGERSPRIEPADSQLLYQYMNAPPATPATPTVPEAPETPEEIKK